MRRRVGWQVLGLAALWVAALGTVMTPPAEAGAFPTRWWACAYVHHGPVFSTKFRLFEFGRP